MALALAFVISLLCQVLNLRGKLNVFCRGGVGVG